MDPSSTLVPTSVFATENQVFVDYQCKGTISSGLSTIVDVTFAHAGSGCPPGLTAWWPLDEPLFGQPVGRDLAGIRHAAHVGPAPSTVPGVDAEGLAFDGAATHLEIDDPLLDVPVTGLTVTLHARPLDTLLPGPILSKGMFGAVPGYGLVVEPGGVLGLYFNDVGISHVLHAPATLPPDTWTCVALVFEPFFSSDPPYAWMDVGVYVGGQPQLSLTVGFASVANGEPLRIGTDDFTSLFYDGALDEIHVFDRVLSAAEIVADCACARSKTDCDLTGVADALEIERDPSLDQSALDPFTGLPLPCPNGVPDHCDGRDTPFKLPVADLPFRRRGV